MSSNTPEQGFTLNNKAAEFARFSAWRYAANAEWVGAIATSVALSGESAPVRIAAAGTYGLGTYYLENRQTDYAARAMERSYEQRNTKPVESTSILKDGIALAAAAYQGAGAGIELNDSLGLPNTKLRRRIQAGAYAGFISLWASPALTEAGRFGFEQFTDNPARSAGITLAGSIAAKFVIIDRIRNLTSRLQSSAKS